MWEINNEISKNLNDIYPVMEFEIKISENIKKEKAIFDTTLQYHLLVREELWKLIKSYTTAQVPTHDTFKTLGFSLKYSICFTEIIGKPFSQEKLIEVRTYMGYNGLSKVAISAFSSKRTESMISIYPNKNKWYADIYHLNCILQTLDTLKVQLENLNNIDKQIYPRNSTILKERNNEIKIIDGIKLLIQIFNEKRVDKEEMTNQDMAEVFLYLGQRFGKK